MSLSPSVRPVCLTACNTLGLSCEAEQVFDLTHINQLESLTQLAHQVPGVWILGGGSNVILPAQLATLVVRVQLKGISLVDARLDAWVIDVAAGENWHDWVTTAVTHGWDGLENLALIPGTVGAAPVQNIGAYGVELDTYIASVTAWNIPEGRMYTLTRKECDFSYRDSMFKRAGMGQWLIVHVRFCLPRPWQPTMRYPDLMHHPLLAHAGQVDPTARQIYDAVCDIRRAKLPDPAVLGNAGSFFKNPVIADAVFERLQQRFPKIVSYPQPAQRVKLAAGWLIEQCGWKGRRIGQVGVHDRQALVLVNYGQATADDLLALARSIQESVENTFGVTLEIEPVVVSALRNA